MNFLCYGVTPKKISTLFSKRCCRTQMGQEGAGADFCPPEALKEICIASNGTIPNKF